MYHFSPWKLYRVGEDGKGIVYGGKAGKTNMAWSDIHAWRYIRPTANPSHNKHYLWAEQGSWWSTIDHQVGDMTSCGKILAIMTKEEWEAERGSDS
jgi:hypothetical protein